MAAIKPFQAIRPAKEYAKQIAALPYDVIIGKKQDKLWKKNLCLF